MSITKLDTKARIRRGGHIQTRPRGESDTAKARRKTPKETQEHYRDSTKSGSFAAKAVYEEKRKELAESRGERANPFTREEFDAIRREEEQINRDRLRKLRDEHDEDEKRLRLADIERRKGERSNT